MPLRALKLRIVFPKIYLTKKKLNAVKLIFCDDSPISVVTQQIAGRADRSHEIQVMAVDVAPYCRFWLGLIDDPEKRAATINFFIAFDGRFRNSSLFFGVLVVKIINFCLGCCIAAEY